MQPLMLEHVVRGGVNESAVRVVQSPRLHMVGPAFFRQNEHGVLVSIVQCCTVKSRILLSQGVDVAAAELTSQLACQRFKQNEINIFVLLQNSPAFRRRFF